MNRGARWWAWREVLVATVGLLAVGVALFALILLVIVHG